MSMTGLTGLLTGLLGYSVSCTYKVWPFIFATAIPNASCSRASSPRGVLLRSTEYQSIHSITDHRCVRSTYGVHTSPWSHHICSPTEYGRTQYTTLHRVPQPNSLI